MKPTYFSSGDLPRGYSLEGSYHKVFSGVSMSKDLGRGPSDLSVPLLGISQG